MVGMRLQFLGATSAHADYGEILQWLAGFTTKPGRIFLIHGEPEAADALRRRVMERFGWTCEIPEYRETVEIADAAGPSSGPGSDSIVDRGQYGSGALAHIGLESV